MNKKFNFIKKNIVILRGISFNAGWEFDVPSILLYPVYKEYISGSTEDDAFMEDFMIDVVCDIPIEEEKKHIELFFLKFIYWVIRFFKKEKIGKYHIFTNKYIIHFDENNEKQFDRII